MIPVRLRLQNFMCYRDPDPLDFRGIHLACLAGDNGHGKSAILDAITWALWGRARARNEDELVRMGAQEMEVEFEFLLGEQQYRVIRKRQLGPRSRGALELQLKSNGDFRPYTASTQRETQSRINNALHLDYHTFINSALLLQGRADEFTVKPPAERKRILADILGLSQYDEYEQRAKELAKEKEVAEREVQARIQEIERELEHRPEYEKELQEAQAELTQLSTQSQEMQTNLREMRDKVKTLEAQKAQLGDVSKRIERAEAQLKDLDGQIAAQGDRLASYESVLQRREEIETGHARLLQTRKRETEYGNRLSQLMTLREESARLEKTIAEAKKGLELKKHVIAEKVADLERLVEQRATLQAEHAKVLEELQELAALQTKWEAHKQSMTELSSESSTLDALNEELRAKMTALQEDLKQLQEPTATCPLCQQSLSQDDRERLLAQLAEEGREHGDRHRHNSDRVKEIASERAKLESELEALGRELKRSPALQGREAQLSRAISEAEEAATSLEAQRELMDSVQQQLDRGDFAPEEQKQLAAVDTRTAALGYDSGTHEQARRDLEALGHFETDKTALDTAEQALTQLREHQQQWMKNREQVSAALETDRQRHAELSAALAGLDELAHELQAQQQANDELRQREGHARQVVGAAQQKLDYCQHLAGERQERAKQRKSLTEERSLYEELREALGKRGVQALIIETVIPELEDEANKLLSRMTDGRMSVHFDTQRDTKAGSTIETLDIKISDEHGSRSYEMYSGGESFRINLAIRIALSKLLARRAGAQLETLIIDEGFGTQDADGRQKLVEAINSIKDDFARIVVITHIEELKDAFPVRINVYKTPTGSQISIS